MDKATADQMVMDLLTKVREKKEAIKKAEKNRPQWKTNCSIGSENDCQARTNIQTIRDQQQLITIYAELIRLSDAVKEAAKALDLEYNNKYRNYPVEDWLDDLKTRAQMLKIEEQKKEIEELDKRINKLVTQDQRREMELQELQKLLAD